jgi:Glu-tRNA(Gln) amidotransferase subunit E-like FAD-binding protein
MAQALRKKGIPLPASVRDITASTVDLKDVPKGITIERNKKPASAITVGRDARFWIRDEGRSLLGYNLRWEDYIVRRTEKKLKPEDIEKILATYLKSLECDGVPVARLSTKEWSQSLRTFSGKTINEKHKQRAFQLVSTSREPLSANWKSVLREPESTDVFVVISGFQSVVGRVTNTRHTDEALAKAFNKKLPDIYGYKTTAAKPISDSNCVELRT